MPGVLDRFIMEEGRKARESYIGTSGQKFFISEADKRQAAQAPERRRTGSFTFSLDRNTGKILKKKGDQSSALTLDDLGQMDLSQKRDIGTQLGFSQSEMDDVANILSQRVRR